MGFYGFLSVSVDYRISMGFLWISMGFLSVFYGFL